MLDPSLLAQARDATTRPPIASSITQGEIGGSDEMVTCKHCQLQFGNAQSLQAHEYRCSHRPTTKRSFVAEDVDEVAAVAKMPRLLSPHRQLAVRCGLQARPSSQMLLSTPQQNDLPERQHKAQLLAAQRHMPKTSPTTVYNNQSSLSSVAPSVSSTSLCTPIITLRQCDRERVFKPYTLTVSATYETAAAVNNTQCTSVCSRRPQPMCAQQSHTQLR